MSKYLREDDVIDAVQGAIGEMAGPNRKIFDEAMQMVFRELDKLQRLEFEDQTSNKPQVLSAEGAAVKVSSVPIPTRIQKQIGRALQQGVRAAETSK